MLNGLSRTVKRRLLNERCQFWYTYTKYDRLPFFLYDGECRTLTQQQIKRILWPEMRFLRPVEDFSITGKKRYNLTPEIKQYKQIFVEHTVILPVPVAARSKVLVCSRSPAGIWVWIPPGAWMSVCCECCVLSDRRLCDELITRPEESYRLWCVVVCDLETSWMRRPWPTGGLSRQKQTKSVRLARDQAAWKVFG